MARFLLVFCLLLCALPCAASPTRYRITPLPGMDVDDGNAFLNDSGMVVCFDVVWKKGNRTRIKSPYRGLQVEATGINNAGQVAGNIDDSVPFLWQQGKLRVVPTLTTYGSTTMARANGLSNQGVIVGYDYDTKPTGNGPQYDAFRYTQGKLIDMGAGQAKSINDKGQIVLSQDGFALCERGKTRRLNLPTGTVDTDPLLINNIGQIAGTRDTTTISRVYAHLPTSHAFLWQKGKTQDFGVFGGESSEAYGMNNRGQVVGKSDIALPDAQGVRRTHAFVWQNGRMTDLNSLLPARSGWVLTEADAINDRGQIVCAGNKGACLLTPIAIKHRRP